MKFGKSGFPTPEFVPIVTGLTVRQETAKSSQKEQLENLRTAHLKNKFLRPVRELSRTGCGTSVLELSNR